MRDSDLTILEIDPRFGEIQVPPKCSSSIRCPRGGEAEEEEEKEVSSVLKSRI